MEWVSGLPNELQSAVWYGAMVGAALLVFVIGWKRGAPLLQKASNGHFSQMVDGQRDLLGKADEVIGGLRQVVACMDAAHRGEVDVLREIARRVDDIYHRIDRK